MKLVKATVLICLILLNSLLGILGRGEIGITGLDRGQTHHFNKCTANESVYTPVSSFVDYSPGFKASFTSDTIFYEHSNLCEGRRLISALAYVTTHCISFASTDIIFPFHFFT